MIDRGAAFITCSKANLVYDISQVLAHYERIHDRLISVKGCAHPLRLVDEEP